VRTYPSPHSGLARKVPHPTGTCGDSMPWFLAARRGVWGCTTTKNEHSSIQQTRPFTHSKRPAQDLMARAASTQTGAPEMEHRRSSRKKKEHVIRHSYVHSLRIAILHLPLVARNTQ
jgi:hypothetical protein